MPLSRVSTASSRSRVLGLSLTLTRLRFDAEAISSPICSMTTMGSPSVDSFAGRTIEEGRTSAILNMTRALSDAVSGDGILVNAICPGLTNTERARGIQQAQADAEGRDVEDLLKEIGDKLPAGRIAEPEEIAHVVVFLASEPCSYMFGSSLYMDGGVRRSTP